MQNAGMPTLYPWLAAWLPALLLAGCAVQRPAPVVPLPVLPAAPIELRVAYAVNPRLPRMDEAQLALLLDAMAGAVREHFGLQVRFAPVQVIALDTLFGTIPADRRAAAAQDIYDFKTGQGDRARLDRAFARGLRQGGESLQDMVAFASPHTGPLGPAPGFEAFGERIAALQLERLDAWRRRQALDGGPAIDGQPFNEFRMWLALGYGEVPFELVLTNQLIASVEYGWPAVHAAVRGGYSNGLTTYNRRSRFGTMSVWSTYAFSGDDEALVQMRAGERYTAEEAARLAGLSGAHELGHQLLHLTHPFGRPACLMSPVPMFSYRAWSRQLSAPDCRLGSDAAMKPGAYRGFSY